MINLFKNRYFYLNNLKLDKYQSKAVFCNNKCYLVVAGAGSGKTLTIVGKIKYLTDVKKVPKDKILCISFTNETVLSLKKSLDKNDLNVDVKTFHRLALDIISSKKNFPIAPSNLLEYITDEYFYSYINFDNIYELLSFYLEENSLCFKEFVNNFKLVAVSFIRIFKSRGYSLSYFTALLFSAIPDNDKILLLLIFKIYVLYEEELFSYGAIDFDDMLNLALDKIDKLKYFKYKYIIIDEYQDTSLIKFELIKKIYEKFDINIMAVGDDFQSIYSFTGCDLSLFLDFQNKFKNSCVIKIRYNYRNSKDIVDISRRFILKNKHQLKKRIISNNFINSSIVIVYSNNVVLDVESIIKDIDNIMILGRNNKDIELLLDNVTFKYENKQLIYLKDISKKLRFLTVHSSKGLEEDYVIVLNVVDDILGFPNKIEENSLYKYLYVNADSFPYSEERRLFYVALTRARKRIYLFTNKDNKSLFITELLNDYKWKLKIIDFEEKALNNNFSIL